MIDKFEEFQKTQINILEIRDNKEFMLIRDIDQKDIIINYCRLQYFTLMLKNEFLVYKLIIKIFKKNRHLID